MTSLIKNKTRIHKNAMPYKWNNAEHCTCGRVPYFFDLEQKDIKPVYYTDIAYEDLDLNAIIETTRGLNWYHDETATKEYKNGRRSYYENLARMHGIDTDKGLAYALESTKPCKTKVFCNVFPVAFDIETTAVTEFEKGKCTKAEAYMYHAQILIDTTIVHCNKWEQVIDVFKRLAKHCDLEYDYTNPDFPQRQLKIMVANLGYEFTFLAPRMQDSGLEMLKVFSRNTHSPITVEYANGIKFVDVLKLTGASLGHCAKSYNLPTRKTDDLDYSKPRNSMTKLTDEELYYCSADVRILGDFHRWTYFNYICNRLPIPTTQTGILRHDVKKLFAGLQNAGKNASKQAKKRASKLKKWVTNTLPTMFPMTYAEYIDDTTVLFTGGYTACNSRYTGVICYDVNGGDFTSSYPYVIMFKKFPMTEFTPVLGADMEQIRFLIKKGRAVIMKLRFHNISSKRDMSAFSASKCYEYKEHNSMSKFIEDYSAIVDNGKIAYADQLTVYITEQDLATFDDFYEWDSVEVLEAKEAKTDYLPEYVRIATMIYYQKKAELKRQGFDGTVDYQLAKGSTNSNFGLMCQKIEMTDIIFNPELNEWAEAIPEQDQLDKVYHNQVFMLDSKTGGEKPRQMLSPYFGVYTTALARRHLFELIKEIDDNSQNDSGKSDVIYCDTDSIYYLNPDRHDAIMHRHNDAIYAENSALIDEWNAEHEFDRTKYDAMAPEDAKKYLRETFGILKENLIDLGEFDKLNKKGNYTRFCTLGAKRYLKEFRNKNGELEVSQTIAGLPKKALTSHCEKIGVDPFDFFRDGMVVPECKKAHRYNEHEHSAIIKDESGNVELMTELSSVGIFEIDFSMSLSSEYRKIIQAHVQAVKRKDLRKYYDEMESDADDK